MIKEMVLANSKVYEGKAPTKKGIQNKRKKAKSLGGHNSFLPADSRLIHQDGEY